MPRLPSRRSRAARGRAVVLLSGGLDSATTLFEAMHQGWECHCLGFDYGQRHRKELASARAVARCAGVPLTMIRLKLPWGGSSLLAGARVARARAATARSLPATYVPGRNTIFISCALSLAETIDARAIFIGANAVDYSGYPDCRPGYLREWDRLIKSLGVRVRVRAPLVSMTKEQIVRRGIALGVPYGKTWSCYQGGARPCGTCDSCRFRARGFRQAGRIDPAISVPGRPGGK